MSLAGLGQEQPSSVQHAGNDRSENDEMNEHNRTVVPKSAYREPPHHFDKKVQRFQGGIPKNVLHAKVAIP